LVDTPGPEARRRRNLGPDRGRTKRLAVGPRLAGFPHVMAQLAPRVERFQVSADVRPSPFDERCVGERVTQIPPITFGDEPIV